jgi:hypothetical protein
MKSPDGPKSVRPDCQSAGPSGLTQTGGRTRIIIGLVLANAGRRKPEPHKALLELVLASIFSGAVGGRNMLLISKYTKLNCR